MRGPLCSILRGEAEGMHARTFLCREALWETFEELAREQRAPIDEVLSEAMRSYAQQRSYGGSTGDEPSAGGRAHHDQVEDALDLARTNAIRHAPPSFAGHGAGAPSWQQPPSMAPPSPRHAGFSGSRAPHSAPPPPPPPRGAASFPAPSQVPVQRPFTQPLGQHLPPPPSHNGGRRFPSGAAPAPPSGHRIPPPPPPRSMPPPLPVAQPYVATSNPYAQPRARVATSLSLTYLNQSVAVTKERFLLGRSRSQADLVLDDPNVSRQHAAIERVGDTWVLADLGSTNGCYIDGQRVSRRQLADGDVIEITTHQVRCTLR
jgi:neural Wiskott-Aldrich syndrome protein